MLKGKKILRTTSSRTGPLLTRKRIRISLRHPYSTVRMQGHLSLTSSSVGRHVRCAARLLCKMCSRVAGR